MVCAHFHHNKSIKYCKIHVQILQYILLVFNTCHLNGEIDVPLATSSTSHTPLPLLSRSIFFDISARRKNVRDVTKKSEQKLVSREYV